MGNPEGTMLSETERDSHAEMTGNVLPSEGTMPGETERDSHAEMTGNVLPSEGTMPGETKRDSHAKMTGNVLPSKEMVSNGVMEDRKASMIIEAALLKERRPGERITAGEEASVFVLEGRGAPAVKLAAGLLKQRG